MTPPPGELPEQPSLFDAPAVEEPWWVRSPASPLDVKRAKIWRGEHPLSGVANAGHLTLHPDESLTCGSCKFFERYPAQGQDIWPPEKCTLGAVRNADGRITAAPRFRVKVPGQWYEPQFENLDSDLVEWFPACKSYQAQEATDD